MKRKNFPLRKYLRACKAQKVEPDPDEVKRLRELRTKKRKGDK